MISFWKIMIEISDSKCPSWLNLKPSFVHFVSSLWLLRNLGSSELAAGILLERWKVRKLEFFRPLIP